VPDPRNVVDFLPRNARPPLLDRGGPSSRAGADALSGVWTERSAAPPPLPIVDVSPSARKVQCSACHLRRSCLPAGLSERELERIDSRMVISLRTVRQGETLFRAGDRFDAMFQIWTGFFKAVVATSQGREQVTGFQMAGDLIGFEAIDTGLHGVDAIALEDSQVCVIPYANLEALGREVPPLQRHLHRIMSREISSDHDAMLRLGSMHSEERVAAFLLSLSDRLRRRGFSASSLVLRMSREEIGSYLGLKLETVSRTFSKLQATGLLFVRQRQIQITDPAGLRHVLDGATV